MERNLPPALLYLLLTWYTKRMQVVRWNWSCHSFFLWCQKMGGGGFCPQFCSPSTCMDDLLTDLKHLGVGCFWKSRYADDLALLAPSLAALWMMLHECGNFCKVLSVIHLRPIDTLWSFSFLHTLYPICFLQFCSVFLRLWPILHGHTLRFDLDDCKDIATKTRDMIRSQSTDQTLPVFLSSSLSLCTVEYLL